MAPKKQPAAKPAPSQPQDKTMAILALVFAIILPLVGLILVLIARKKYPEGVEGHGLITAALIISIIFLVLRLLSVIMLIAGFASMAAYGI